MQAFSRYAPLMIDFGHPIEMLSVHYRARKTLLAGADKVSRLSEMWTHGRSDTREGLQPVTGARVDR